MESAETGRTEEVEAPKNLPWSGKTYFAFSLVIYLFVELDFSLMLWRLIASHTRFDYLINAVAFEMCLIASLVALWRCLVPSKSEEKAATNRRDAPFQTFVLAMMLLVALMQFSRITQLSERITPR